MKVKCHIPELGDLEAVKKMSPHCFSKVILITCNISDDIIKFVTKLLWQVWYSYDITKLLQNWQDKIVTYNIVIYHAFIRLVPIVFQQVWRFNMFVHVTTCRQVHHTCWQLGTESAKKTFWQLADKRYSFGKGKKTIIVFLYIMAPEQTIVESICDKAFKPWFFIQASCLPLAVFTFSFLSLIFLKLQFFCDGQNFCLDKSKEGKARDAFDAVQNELIKLVLFTPST